MAFKFNTFAVEKIVLLNSSVGSVPIKKVLQGKR